MRKSELGAWSGSVGSVIALILAGCSAPEPTAESPGPAADSAAPAAPGPPQATAAPAEAAARSLPVVPVAASLCEAVSAADQGAAAGGAPAAMVAAERAACAGQLGEAVRRWREVAQVEPRLGDIAHRRIAQATGGAQRGMWPSQTLAGAITSGGDGEQGLEGQARGERWLFALEPAPWVRGRVDALRWRRFAQQPEGEAARAWARRWLMERDAGDADVWLERFTLLREQPGLTSADRLMLSGRCVDRFVDAEEQPLSPVAVRRLLPNLERCLGSQPEVDGLPGNGRLNWLMGEAEAADEVGLELAARESRWRELMLDRRSDLDAAGLAIAASLGQQPTAWRGSEALLACVELAEALGESEQAEACMDALGAVATALVWDDGLRHEVALQRALRNPRPEAGFRALASTGDELSPPRRAFIEARIEGQPASFRNLIREAPLSYEAVFADRLLRQDGGAGELASKLAALRFASGAPAPVDAAWAAEWLATQGFISLARSEALLQAEVTGGQSPRLWSVAADLLARNGEFALAHSAARRLTNGLGQFPDTTATIPGRVWREAYPLRWEKEIAAASKSQGVPKSLLLAFLRRESGFDADARSEVGARGLMQVLPDTAREVASRHGISMARGLGDPALNLEISAAMIADLMREFGGRTEVVAAAYSAGPAKARRWIRGREGADLWLWTEAIPYDVVRSYAREIAVSAALYAAWLGEVPPEAHVTVEGER